MTRQGANTIRIAGRTLLLATGRTATHLVAPADGPPARPALEAGPGGRAATRDAGPGRGYDPARLFERRWAETTLCGRDWIEMALGEAGGSHPWRDEPVLAPSCGACLRIVEASFPKAARPPGVGVLVAVVAETVRRFGSAQVRGVPPTHAEDLRSAIRARLRAEGLASRTYRQAGVLHVVSEAAWKAVGPEVRRALDRGIADALAGDLDAAPPQRRAVPGGVVRWETWVIDVE